MSNIFNEIHELNYALNAKLSHLEQLIEKDMLQIADNYHFTVRADEGEILCLISESVTAQVVPFSDEKTLKDFINMSVDEKRQFILMNYI